MQRASDILAAVYRQRPLDEAGEQALIESYWREAAGEKLARVSRPVHRSRGLLIVEVDSPEWIGGLESVAARIIARLNGVLGRGAIGAIRFRTAPPLRKPPARARTADPSLDPAAGIKDPVRRRLYVESKRVAGGER